MMTVLDDRPRNGARQTIPIPASREDEAPPAAESDPAQGPDELQRQLENTRREVDVLDKLTEEEARGAFLHRRSTADRNKDAAAARRVRNKQRREKERAATAAIRTQSRERRRAWWDDRAHRFRDRILDPARALGSIQRTWTACAAVIIAVIAGGLLYLTDTVKQGVVGPDGPVVGYFIEPMASAMLVVSLAIQLLGHRQGSVTDTARRRFKQLDATLCAASMFLATVPWGVRFGWDLGTTATHLIVPGLVALAVASWHLCSTTVTDLIAQTKTDPVLVERLAMLRTALVEGELPADPSKTRIEKHLRDRLGSISQADASRVARSFLGK